jgi:hypothetical protein
MRSRVETLFSPEGGKRPSYPLARLGSGTTRAHGQGGADSPATEELEAVADRGYYDGQEILACEEAGVTVTLPKPMTSGAKAQGRFGKQDFVYLPEEDVYRCPAGEIRKYYLWCCTSSAARSPSSDRLDQGRRCRRLDRTASDCVTLARQMTNRAFPAPMRNHWDVPFG